MRRRRLATPAQSPHHDCSPVPSDTRTRKCESALAKFKRHSLKRFGTTGFSQEDKSRKPGERIKDVAKRVVPAIAAAVLSSSGSSSRDTASGKRLTMTEVHPQPPLSRPRV
jgi:hypothetical protein